MPSVNPGAVGSPASSLPPSTESSPKTKLAAKRGDRFIQETRAMVDHLQTVNFEQYIQPLRPEHTFSLTIPKRVREYKKGGANLHIPIMWDDGVKWFIRIKLHWTVSFGEVNEGIRRLVLESERETMIFLKRNGLPVPETFGGVFVTDGIEFVVVECIDGIPCSRPIHRSLTGPPLDRLIRQFAAVQIKLSAFTFPSLGSLYPTPPNSVPGPSSSGLSSVRVGPSISLRFANSSAPYFLGPFHGKTAGERYLANITLILRKLEQGDRSLGLGHPGVVYLVHLWYRDSVISIPRLWQQEEVMIRHADDQGDHILSDSEGNIHGIIDWEWAVTSVKSDAFSAPMGLVDIPKFQTGSNDLSPHEIQLAKFYTELGRPDLGDCVRAGKLHQRLWSCIGSKPTIGKIQGLADSSDLPNPFDLALVRPRDNHKNEGGKPQTGKVEVPVLALAEWCEVMVETYKGNEVLVRLLADQMSWTERCAIKEGVDVEERISTP